MIKLKEKIKSTIDRDPSLKVDSNRKDGNAVILTNVSIAYLLPLVFEEKRKHLL